MAVRSSQRPSEPLFHLGFSHCGPNSRQGRVDPDGARRQGQSQAQHRPDHMLWGDVSRLIANSATAINM